MRQKEFDMKNKQKVSSKFKARSYFTVLNNVDHLFNSSDNFFNSNKFSDETRQKIQTFRDNLKQPSYTPEEIVDYLIHLWTDGRENRRSCAVNYEIGDNGTHHCHMVLEDKSQVRFSAIQKLFPTIHVELTRGNKEQVMEYVNKKGKFEEKNHTIVVPAKIQGSIEAHQGGRSDLDYIQELLESGATPEDIMCENISFRRYSKMIKEHFFQLRLQETPVVRKVNVYWHMGEQGSGKSFTQTTLIDKYGRHSVYVVTDYTNGGFDLYQAEQILFLDEYKGQFPYGFFLSLLDIYSNQVHARYANIYALWTEVHISSILSPIEAYYEMLPKERRIVDSIEQLFRRIDYVIYHFVTDDKQYKQLVFSTKDYKDLKERSYLDIEKLCQQYHQRDGTQSKYIFSPKDFTKKSISPTDTSQKDQERDDVDEKDA